MAKRGRPQKISDIEQLENKICAYFAECDLKEKPYTICGLAYALDIDRKTLLNYEKSSEFFPTIKKAKLRCEMYAEEQLYVGKNAAGVIFNLKNNYDWKDKIENDLSITESTQEAFLKHLKELGNNAD